MLDVHAEDLAFVTLWPEPEDGYAAWLAPKDEYRRLFGLLSRPGCLELLEHLHCHKRGYFVVQAVAKQLDMPGETVEEKTVLQNFSACFEAGGKYALTGPFGCGKSTLLMLLLGCLPGYTGSVRLGGRELSQYRPEQLWHQICYIQQDVFLFDATIRDNLTLGEEFSEDTIQKALRDSALEEDLRSMPRGLDTVAGENGGNLSGGQRQRVAIAWAMFHSRSILLVDEGTSALDRENADIIERNLLSRTELTLILVSHHLSPERKAQFTRVFTLPGGLLRFPVPRFPKKCSNLNDILKNSPVFY